nr:phospho-sugar mutase [Opitutales bacterium]
MVDLKSFIASSKLLDSARKNLSEFLDCKGLPKWASESISELLINQEYDELNDRFFKTSEFGTGGIRGRTVGRIVTKAEQGTNDHPIPEHASIGLVYVNDFNIVRATIALFKHCKSFLNKHQRMHERPALVISRDTRCFSKHFCELCASTWTRLGGHAMIFDGPRSTPQLSFSVRYLGAIAGVMITASHNPWHDNGFKAYFADGAQMVDPHASSVIAEFNKLTLEDIVKFLDVDLSSVSILNDYADKAYLDAVAETVLDERLLKSHSPSVVFTPLHGVGAISALPAMDRFGIRYTVVDAQNDQDPLFSTVKSPNPENHEALALAVDQARKCGANVVLATDPDDDRVALSARNKSGKFEYFSGNIAWSLLLDYRLSTLQRTGFLNSENCQHFAVIKTFVTTPLIEKIAANYGVKCINTLTGFKWIGDKINDYENSLISQIFQKEGGLVIDYDKTETKKRRELLRDNSTLFLFGCEESYGCLSSDIVRDKDANSAVLMLCELAAYAAQNKKTICDLRNELFDKYGFFGESVLNIYYDSADGAQKIANILDSYRADPPKIVGDAAVVKFVDFQQGTICDRDGKKIEKQNFFFIELANGCRYAVRASGTEPKLKFYMFCESILQATLASTREKTDRQLD